MENAQTINKHQLPTWWSRDVNEIDKTLTDLVCKKFSKEQTTAILTAKYIADEQHQGEKRAGGENYIIHPYRIAVSLIMEFSVYSYEIIIAALLHDLLENTGYQRRLIEEKFGETVLNIVDTLTRSGKHPRTGETITDVYFQNIIKRGEECILIKLADKLDNVRDALNHLRLDKRKLYVKESYEVYFPLILHLRNKSLRKRIMTLFEEAMENHSFYRDYFPKKYFMDSIKQNFDSLTSGEYILYNNLSNTIPELDKYLDIILLFNPNLLYWLNSDYVQIVKISADLKTMISNVCYKIGRIIEQRQIDRLLQIASMPSIFAEPNKYSLWMKVRDQLNSIVSILKSDPLPPWVMPILKNPKWILLVIHSRLFVPANMDSSLWQSGSVIALRDKDVYKGIADDDKSAEEWGLVLYSLLCHREALWRYYNGYGSSASAHHVLGLIKRLSSNINSFEELFSMRFLGEYLDMTVIDHIPEDTVVNSLSELWKELGKGQEIHKGISLEERPGRKDLLYGTFHRNNQADISSLEIVGFERIRSLSEEKNLLDKFYHLLKILSLKFTNTDDLFMVWVVFDVREILKREKYFLEALQSIGEDTNYEHLKAIGIDVYESTFQNNRISTVTPSKWLALRNRLPEITDMDVKKINQQEFSATAIFDNLLMDKLEGNNAFPFFIPRVFRVLDTMADFDGFNVQGINIFFDSSEKLKNFKVYLPIPKNVDERGKQDQRKEILSRFIATTIFNYAVTIGIYSAFVDCDPPLSNREKLCFANTEIEKKILAHAKKFGYFETYGSFVQNFNFEAFDIKSRAQLADAIPFTKQDMRKGNFLGIDIGGTDTKICLVVSEKAEKLLKTIPTFENGAKQIDISEFCDRLISEITASLKEGSTWEDIAGVGISWPGAVRRNKIVGFSATLGRILPPDSNKTLNNKSLPQEIQSVDVAGTFLKQLALRFPKISDSFVTVIENDGNAEAFGNYCAIETDGSPQGGGKLVIKLGTSLAGGHINSYGAISSHQVAEFSKVIMDFNVRPFGPSRIDGPAREFVSSKGVRNLSRKFVFNREILFGSLSGKNESDNLESRIESFELGGLLTLWDLVDEDPLENNRYLNELTECDNRLGKERYCDLLKEFIRLSKQGNPDIHNFLNSYIKNLGRYQFTLRYGNFNNSAKDVSMHNDEEAIWRLGTDRLYLLCTGNELHRPCGHEKFPAELSVKILAKKALGAVALFSQLGLHIAHLIVLLYNIYRKERFNEVILTGGVLSNLSGLLVKRQTEAFLLKYYDKVYGPGKNIELNAVVLAHNDVPAVVGPYGAAMIANRFHKMNGLSQMRKIVDFNIHNLKPGDTISFNSLLKLIRNIRCEDKDIRDYLERLVAESILLPMKDEEDTYIKTLSS